MTSRFWIDFAVLIGFIVAQITMFRHLEFWGLQTNIVLIYLVWLASVRDRTYTILMSIFGAILMDVLLDAWGVYLFSKPLMILIFYGFIHQQRDVTLQIGQLFTIFLFISLVYNLVFLLISSFAGIYTTDFEFVKLWIGNSLYIAITAVFFYLIKPEQKR